MAYLDIILLAGVALFLGYRLWLLLGTHEKDRPIRRRESSEDDLVIPVRSKASESEEKGEKVVELETVASINDDRFLQGATLAFRQIVSAYANGDVAALKKLLASPLLQTFEEAIAKRKRAKKNLEVEVSRISSAEVIDKHEEKGEAFITVRFVSEQCLVTRDTRGKVLEGDPDHFVEVTDLWTFTRSLKSKNPNWKLVATQVPEV